MQPGVDNSTGSWQDGVGWDALNLKRHVEEQNGNRTTMLMWQETSLSVQPTAWVHHTPLG